jgi:hypothetical protein
MTSVVIGDLPMWQLHEQSFCLLLPCVELLIACFGPESRFR